MNQESTSAGPSSKLHKRHEYGGALTTQEGGAFDIFSLASTVTQADRGRGIVDVNWQVIESCWPGMPTPEQRLVGFVTLLSLGEAGLREAINSLLAIRGFYADRDPGQRAIQASEASVRRIRVRGTQSRPPFEWEQGES